VFFPFWVVCGGGEEGGGRRRGGGDSSVAHGAVIGRKRQGWVVGLPNGQCALDSWERVWSGATRWVEGVLLISPPHPARTHSHFQYGGWTPQNEGMDPPPPRVAEHRRQHVTHCQNTRSKHGWSGRSNALTAPPPLHRNIRVQGQDGHVSYLKAWAQSDTC
jgi:hypothetical protein